MTTDPLLLYLGYFCPNIASSAKPTPFCALLSDMTDLQSLDPSRNSNLPQILGETGYSTSGTGYLSQADPQQWLDSATGLLSGSTPRLEGLHGPPDGRGFSGGLLSVAQHPGTGSDNSVDAVGDVAGVCFTDDPRFSLSGAVSASQAQAQMLLHDQAAELLPPQQQGDHLMHHPLHPHHPPVFQIEHQISEDRKQQPKRQRRYGNGPAEPARRQQHSKPTRKCQVDECPVQPSYNYPTETKRIYCRTHKKDGMVNLCNKNGCRGLNCHKSPRFNFPNVARGIFCDAHKLDGMVNVTDRRCQHPGCTKHPTSNFPGQSGRVFCATHRREGMQDRSH